MECLLARAQIFLAYLAACKHRIDNDADDNLAVANVSSNAQTAIAEDAARTNVTIAMCTLVA